MRKGFTILELLIVIAVIAIIVGIALPRFRGMREEGFVAQAKAELRTLQTALESYYTHAGSYPAATSSLTSATPNIVGSALPTDPFTASGAYGYAKSANGNHYVVYSVGPGGNGSATISDAGVVTETNGSSCIFASGSARDTTGP
jgi:general secretion pathway protein G